MRNILVCILLVFLYGQATADARLDLDDYEGQIVLVDFWASWCVPCRRSFPWMNEMHEKYADDGLVIIAINLDNSPGDATAFLEEYSVRFEIAYDADKSLARKFSVQAMPTSFLLSRNGDVIDSHMGFKVKQQAEYEAAIVAALATD